MQLNKKPTVNLEASIYNYRKFYSSYIKHISYFIII